MLYNWKEDSGTCVCPGLGQGGGDKTTCAVPHQGSGGNLGAYIMATRHKSVFLQVPGLSLGVGLGLEGVTE